MKYTKEFLEPIVLKSKAISEVLRYLKLNANGGNHAHISKTIKKYNIDTSHFLGQSWNRGKSPRNRHTIESFIKLVLKLNGMGWQSHQIKLKLFELNLKERKCGICGQNEIWNNNKLGLELDHINGIHNDNRLENLRILCPNCHSQMPTQGVRNIHNGKIINIKVHKEKIIKNKIINICNCGKKIKNNSKTCVNCYSLKQRKVNRPSFETLQEEVKTLGYTGTGRKYGVSDNTIRKWIKFYTK